VKPIGLWLPANRGKFRPQKIPAGKLCLRPLAVITPVRLGHMRADATPASIVPGSSIIEPTGDS